MARPLIGRVRSRWRGSAALAALTLVVAGAVVPASAATADTTSADCVGSPMRVTATCTDPQYSSPVIDSAKDETSPVPNHHVSGHFDGTNIQFNVYLPAKSQWQGRFFQWTYPTAFTPADDTAVGSERAIGFALSHGAYAVQAGNAGISLGYRHDAAAAKFAKSLATSYYGTDQRIYGYLYGGSGGSYQTIGAAENTTGVWDAFVPYIIGTPMSTPYTFFIRSFADLVLGDKAALIKAAVMPGGDGDPYDGLDPAQQAMLRELAAFGVPLQAWQNPDYVLGHAPYFPDGLLGFGSLIKALDPTYVTDFWNAPGYLGTEQSPLGDAVRAALAARGDTDANRWDIALRAYYRYQLPPASAGYVGFEQFRAADGTALYPQRTVVWGPLVTGGTSGNATYSGQITGKVIVVDNLYDSDALAVPADWYARRVRSAIGKAAFDRNFRVYFNDHADHQEAPVTGVRATYLITFWGMVEQAVVDAAAWVENGTEPPVSTQYGIDGGQVVLPPTADQRRGVQPTVDLTVRNSRTVQIKAGQQVQFQGRIVAPDGTGAIVATAWDFQGDGTYTEDAASHPRSSLNVQVTHRFDTPGVYYVALRATAQRDGSVSPYTQVQNLDRVRVVVTEG